ncbi:alpha/beta fold hydrolase [Williamsia sp. D3]|uniref:alpha/beta fold hydrolase n=1 Tax=Williamsia sp. D3 TaxID=1313067 RepID=UPI001F3E9436|nr:alpha/beta hydrolase [Williamsia sp. D3]
MAQSECEQPPVVLLHGFPQSRASWDEVMRHLDQVDVPALSFDQRGYSPGARPSGVDEYRIEHLIDDVVEVCRGYGYDRIQLVGHDWGATVAWQVAARHPDLVHSLIAVAVPHPNAFAWAITHDADQIERSWYMDFLKDDPSAVALLTDNDGAGLRAGYGDVVDEDTAQRHLKVLLQPGALDAAINWYRAARDDPPQICVSTPTTLIWGDGDMAVGRAGIERSRVYVTGEYRLVELAGISHWIPEHAPEDVVEEIVSQRERFSINAEIKTPDND